MSTQALPRDQVRVRLEWPVDLWLLVPVLALMGLGLLMVASVTLDLAERQHLPAFFFVLRQGLFIGLGMGLMALVWRIPLRLWERSGPILFLLGLVMLVLVLAVGHRINGSIRWLPLGPVNLQVSEFVKVFAVLYVAGYLVRRGGQVREGWAGFLKPLVLLGLAAALLLAEPDFGSVVVLMSVVLGMMFLGGARLWQFLALAVVALAAGVALVWMSPYRLQRFLAFLDPWQDPFDKGFQLTQALMALGRGEWLGVGLGEGVQKLAYLPEAHTDFLFAMVGEELGLLGAWAVIALFSLLVWRGFRLGRVAELAGRPFAGYLARGLALLIGLQAMVNLAVNMGLLPTKGLTLPFVSYGGSSLLAACLSAGLLLRVDRELCRQREIAPVAREERPWPPE